MVTISLDEYGEFEKEENRPLFVGGLMFDDREEENEERIERDRIRSYYQRVIKDAGDGGDFCYPQALHSDGNRGRDRMVVAPVKERVKETMPEFLQRGTYCGEKLTGAGGRPIRDRRGCYHLFVILKSDDGKRSLLVKNANMLARDDHAANRYFHMAGSVVNRIIFHNPIYAGQQMPPLNLDIATRSTGAISQMDEKTREEFREQSYRQKPAGHSDYRYSIMNQDVYRTLIAKEMVDSKKTSVRILRLEVRSIQYQPDAHFMEFLYMADSICSILGFRLAGDSADLWLDQINERVTQLNTGEGNLVLGYDEIDNAFSEAWEAYERHDLYEALSVCCDARRAAGRFAEHYKETWFPFLERRARATVTPEHFTRAVAELNASLVTSNLDQEKLVYMMDQYEQMVPAVEQKFRSKEKLGEVLFELYETGVTACCHTGDPKRAMEYHEKCRQYAIYVGVDDFLRLSGKLAVCLEDSFLWDRAQELQEETVENQMLASEMRRTVFQTEGETGYLEEAKAVSQLARILAEKRDPAAEEKFRSALSLMDHASANYKITQSYLLHFYADMGMREAFEAEATDYFDGNQTYGKRLRYLLKQENGSLSLFSENYALYVLVRGLYLFGLSQINEELWNKLKGIRDLLKEKNGRDPGGHPWEIIYKYLEMTAIRRRDFKAADAFAELRNSCLRYHGDILTALCLYGETEIADLRSSRQQADQLSAELAEYLRAHFPAFRETEFSADGERRRKQLDAWFTFMYR